MSDLIIHGSNITKQLEAHFKSGSSDRSFLFHVPAECYFDVNLELVKVLVNHHKYKGVYITFNKPYQKIVSLLQAREIATEPIWFIDVSSINAQQSKATAGTERKQSEKCIHLPSAMTIPNLITATNKALHAIPGSDKFLFLESLTTLSFYFPDKDIVTFARFLSDIVDNEKIEWVILQSTPPTTKIASYHHKIAPHVHRVISLVSEPDTSKKKNEQNKDERDAREWR